jgi:hypothetical protein
LEAGKLGGGKPECYVVYKGTYRYFFSEERGWLKLQATSIKTVEINLPVENSRSSCGFRYLFLDPLQSLHYIFNQAMSNTTMHSSIALLSTPAASAFAKTMLKCIQEPMDPGPT